MDDRAVLPRETRRLPPFATDFTKMVNSKLLVGDVTAAVRIIASDDSVITPAALVVTAQRIKHPPSPLDLRPPPIEPVSQLASWAFGRSTNSRGRTAFVEIHCNLCSKCLRCQIPQHARDLHFAANLTALR